MASKEGSCDGRMRNMSRNQEHRTWGRSQESMITSRNYQAERDENDVR